MLFPRAVMSSSWGAQLQAREHEGVWEPLWGQGAMGPGLAQS